MNADHNLVTARRPLDYWLLWAVTIALFVFNVFMLREYLVLRERAAEETVALITTVGELRRSSFEHTIHIDEVLPVAASIPLDLSIRVPVEHTLQIDTVAQVPIRILGQTIALDIPIVASVPLNLNLEVPIAESLTLNTAVPATFDVPVTIAVADSALGPILDRAYLRLIEIADGLGAGATRPNDSAPTAPAGGERPAFE